MGPHVIQVTLSLDGIEVRERSRLAVGGIDSLAESIAKRGLLHPPVVRRAGDETAGTGVWVLVAGQRRLEALRLLGHTSTVVTVAHTATDELSALHAEGDENTERQPFTPEEAVRHRKRIEVVVAAQAAERMVQAPGEPQGTKLVSSSNLEEQTKPHERTTRHVTAKGTGYGASTLDKAEQVVAAAEDEELPEPVREAAAEARREMNETGKVDGAHRRLAEAVDEYIESDDTVRKAKLRKSAMAALSHTCAVLKFEVDDVVEVLDADDVNLLWLGRKSDLDDWFERLDAAMRRKNVRVVGGSYG